MRKTKLAIVTVTSRGLLPYLLSLPHSARILLSFFQFCFFLVCLLRGDGFWLLVVAVSMSETQSSSTNFFLLKQKRTSGERERQRERGRKKKETNDDDDDANDLQNLFHSLVMVHLPGSTQ